MFDTWLNCISFPVFVIFRVYKSDLGPSGSVGVVGGKITSYVHKVKTMVTKAVDKGNKSENGEL